MHVSAEESVCNLTPRKTLMLFQIDEGFVFCGSESSICSFCLFCAFCGFVNVRQQLLQLLINFLGQVSSVDLQLGE